MTKEMTKNEQLIISALKEKKSTKRELKKARKAAHLNYMNLRYDDPEKAGVYQKIKKELSTAIEAMETL